ncbi:MAG: trypsin-like peptidase domain-containing protein [Gammaproteobacteria bacterium]|nr:trypsin-like peptidase domain-containing protein [Gammaproteobacteria bacterium]
MIRYLIRALPVIAGIAAGILIGLAIRPSPAIIEPRQVGYADAVAQAAPSVVNIYTTRVVTRRVHPLCDLPRFREMCERFPGSEQRMQGSLGSGVIVGDGHILTNNHVIADADEILVALADGREAPAMVVGTDPETDLAVLKVDLEGLMAIHLAPTGDLRVGDVVLAIGNPFGIGQTVSSGIVSALGRHGLSANAPYEDFIQTDAAINPGNSGGALVDAQGRLVGVNSMIFSRSGGSHGIGFAIPANLALDVLASILEQGRVVRGWLGVEVRPVEDSGESGGLFIAGISPHGPADQAGIQPGDLITAINGAPVGSAREVGQRIAMLAPGSQVEVQVVRNGGRQKLVATVGQRPTLDRT